MREPLVSVGIPVYNGGSHLARAVESALAQTHRHLEIIVSDNASGDDTPDICRRYAQIDSRISFVRHSFNRGGSWNFNEVMRRASGEYFAWLAHDDRWDPSFVGRCVETLSSDRSAVLCHSWAQPVTADGRPAGQPWRECVNDDNRQRERWRTILTNWELNPAIYGVMRLQAARLTRGMLALPSSDLLFLAELSLHGKIVQVPAILQYKQVPADGEPYRSPYEMAAYMGGNASTRVLARGAMQRGRVTMSALRGLRSHDLSWRERARFGADAVAVYLGSGLWKVDLKETIRHAPWVADRR